jgi:SM-20-related protein
MSGNVLIALKRFKLNYLSCLYKYMYNQNDILIDSFLENNIGIDTDFLSKDLSNGLQKNIQQLQDDNLMTYAGIGNETIMDTTQKMRGDKIYWMDKSHDNAF